MPYGASSPAAADPGEGFVGEGGVVAAEEGAELAGVVLDVADVVDVKSLNVAFQVGMEQKHLLAFRKRLP